MFLVSLYKKKTISSHHFVLIVWINIFYGSGNQFRRELTLKGTWKRETSFQHWIGIDNVLMMNDALQYKVSLSLCCSSQRYLHLFFSLQLSLFLCCFCQYSCLDGSQRFLGEWLECSCWVSNRCWRWVTFVAQLRLSWFLVFVQCKAESRWSPKLIIVLRRGNWKPMRIMIWVAATTAQRCWIQTVWIGRVNGNIVQPLVSLFSIDWHWLLSIRCGLIFGGGGFFVAIISVSVCIIFCIVLGRWRFSGPVGHCWTPGCGSS